MPTLLRSWLATPYMSGEPIVDTMGQWQDEQDYRDFTSPPYVQVFQDWVKTLGGRAAMAPIAEVWLRDTNEDRARIVREGKAAFYMGRKDMQEHLYGKLRRRFSSFNIQGWKLPEILPFDGLASTTPFSISTAPSSEFLVTPEMVQAGVTSSVAVVSEQDIRGGSVSGSIDHASTDTSIGAVLILLAQVAPQFAPVLDCPVAVAFEQDIRGASMSGSIDHACTDTSMGAALILLAQEHFVHPLVLGREDGHYLVFLYARSVDYDYLSDPRDVLMVLLNPLVKRDRRSASPFPVRGICFNSIPLLEFGEELGYYLLVLPHSVFPSLKQVVDLSYY
nr:uncharacterized protein LOC109157428 [Ipomoea trifida]